MSDIVIKEYNKDLIGFCLGSDAGSIFRKDDGGQMSILGATGSANNGKSSSSVVPVDSSADNDTNTLGGRNFKRVGSIMSEQNNLDSYLKDILSDGKRLATVLKKSAEMLVGEMSKILILSTIICIIALCCPAGFYWHTLWIRVWVAICMQCSVQACFATVIGSKDYLPGWVLRNSTLIGLAVHIGGSLSILLAAKSYSDANGSTPLLETVKRLAGSAAGALGLLAGWLYTWRGAGKTIQKINSAKNVTDNSGNANTTPVLTAKELTASKNENSVDAKKTDGQLEITSGKATSLFFGFCVVKVILTLMIVQNYFTADVATQNLIAVAFPIFKAVWKKTDMIVLMYANPNYSCFIGTFIGETITATVQAVLFGESKSYQTFGILLGFEGAENLFFFLLVMFILHREKKKFNVRKRKSGDLKMRMSFNQHPRILYMLGSLVLAESLEIITMFLHVFVCQSLYFWPTNISEYVPFMANAETFARRMTLCLTGAAFESLTFLMFVTAVYKTTSVPMPALAISLAKEFKVVLFGWVLFAQIVILYYSIDVESFDDPSILPVKKACSAGGNVWENGACTVG